MGLSILSQSLEKQEKTFKKVALAALKAKLYFLFTEWAYIGLNRVEVNIQKYSGTETCEWFLMDILSEKEQAENRKKELLCFVYEKTPLFMIAGTDNAPSHLNYDFSLSYLRLCPEHLISIYDCIFTLDEIEQVEKNKGWHEDWINTIKRNRKK